MNHPAVSVRTCGTDAAHVRVCDGLCCEMAGAHELRAALPPHLEARTMSCPGRCDRAPAVMVGSNPLAPANREDVVTALVAHAWQESDRSHLHYVDYASYRGAGGYRLLQQCLAGGRDAASDLRRLEESGLPFTLRTRPLSVRIGGGALGGFRDRALLQHDPHRLLEGLLIASWVAGVDEAAIELREDDRGCAEMLLHELDTLAQELPIAGLSAIHLRRAADDARASTHDVEALHWVREVLESGRAERRWVAVCGRVRDAGLKCVPAGITVQALIDEHCGGMPPGQRLYAYLCRGGSAGIEPFTNEVAACGDVIVLSDRDSAVGAARSLLQQFVRASAGPGGAPSHLGAKLARLIERPHWDLALLGQLSELMHAIPAVPTARAAAAVLDGIATHFRAEVE
jgi:formate dehydrogenase beta subunit